MLQITEIKKEEAGQALELIHEVYRELPEKSWFSLDGDGELLNYMNETGFALGVVEENAEEERTKEHLEDETVENALEKTTGMQGDEKSAAEEKKTGKESEIAAVFIARTTNLGEENLGQYLKLNPEEMQKVAHMEIAMVRKEYRGQRLQNRMMQEAEPRLKEAGYRYLMGTAHPENVYSVNNFKWLGYEIVAEVLKYGGLPRYVFCKEI